MIVFETARKEYETDNGRVVALEGFDLSVDKGETVCLIGTSGSGKTTALKMVNRLVEPTAGRILVGGRDITGLDVIALRRSIGYVIQSGGLFPHMTVAENIGLLLKLEKWEKPRIKERVGELLDLVSLEPNEFSERRPGELSGGQQQRVCVARALAFDPDIVLMDEPFGALDPITRAELQAEFQNLRDKVGKTVLLVTHDLNEAFKLGNRIALLEQGRLIQVGTAGELRERPANKFVAEFVGAFARGGGE